MARTINFAYVDLHITEDHLSYDQMHLHSRHQHKISDGIVHHFNDLLNRQQQQQQHELPRSARRSREAITRRNKKRHTTLLVTQKSHTLTRPIHRDWKLQDVKNVLKHYQVRFSRLPEIHHHTLQIQFNNSLRLNYAVTALPLDVFNQLNLHKWLQEHQP